MLGKSCVNVIHAMGTNAVLGLTQHGKCCNSMIEMAWKMLQQYDSDGRTNPELV